MGSVAIWLLQPCLGQETTNQLPDLVVSTTRLDGTAADQPQTVSLVTPAELRGRLPNEPVEALRDEPGIWVQQTGAGGGTPILRGFIGNQVLYLVDGIRINNGLAFGGPNPFFNQVDVGSIDYVEVLRGPGSVQYGSDALGGILNTHTKSVGRFPAEPEYGGLMSSHYSTASESLYGHLEGYTANQKANVMVGVTGVDVDDYRAGGDLGRLENTSYKSTGLLGKAQVKASDEQVLTLGYVHDERTDVERYDQSNRNANGIPRFFTPHEQRDIVYVRDHIQPHVPGLTDVEPYVYYQRYAARSDFNVETETSAVKSETDEQQDHYGAGLQAVSPVSDSVTLIYGGDARYEELESSVKEYATDNASGAVASSEPFGGVPDGTYDVLDAFVMADWMPIQAARVTSGVRYESAHLDSAPSLHDTSPGFTVEDLNLDSRWNSVTYSLGGLYWLSDSLALASDVATGFRSPNYNDALSFGAFTFGVDVPSPDVKPETSTTWELGPRFESKTVRAQLTGYYTWLDDLITTHPTGGFVDLDGNGQEDAGEAAYDSVNGGEAWIQGVEASGDWACCPVLTLFGNMSWADSYNETADEPVRFMPPLNGMLGARFQPNPQAWWVEAFARMAAAQDAVTAADKRDPARASDPSQRFPSDTNPPLRDDFSVPGYTTYHLRAGVPVRENATLLLACNNLTDKAYRQAYSRQDAPGIDFTLGFELKF